MLNDSEVNVVALDEALARRARLGLWEEHLETGDVGGDLMRVVDELWRPIAAEQLENLEHGRPLTHRLVMLPGVSPPRPPDLGRRPVARLRRLSAGDLSPVAPRPLLGIRLRRQRHARAHRFELRPNGPAVEDRDGGEQGPELQCDDPASGPYVSPNDEPR